MQQGSYPIGSRTINVNTDTATGVVTGATCDIPLNALATAIAAYLGLTIPIPVSSGGTGAITTNSARANLGAAASGANNDITSLSGLTTALSIAQGGTGATTAAGARTNLGLGSMATQNSTAVSITGGSISGVSFPDLASTAVPGGAGLIGFDSTTLAQFFLSKSNRVVDSITALRGISKTTYTRAFVTGYYTAGDGGGGEYWYDSSDTTSADNGGTVIVANDGGRWKLQWFGSVSVLQFGVKADAGTTDNSATLANAQAWQAANAVRNELRFPAGIYGYSVSPNWAINHARILADGEVRLRYSGTGNAVIVDAGSGSQNVYDVTFGNPGKPFIIEVASTGLHACFWRAVHHSTVCIKPRSAGAASAGLLVNFAVCTNFYVTCSVNEDGGWYGGAGGKPTYGINLTQRNAAEQVSYCNFYNPVIEGVGTGIYIDYADGNTFYSGTAEGCSTGGIFESANARGNRFIGMDLEVNTTYDIDSAGLQTMLDQVDTNKLITLRGNDQLIRGGVHNQITITGTALFARLRDLRYNRNNNGSTVSDSGVQTTKDNVVNYVTGTLDKAQVPNVTNYGAAVSSPAAPTSGTAWQNTNTYPVEVIFSGGTITNVQFSRDNVTYYSVTGSTNGAALRLAPGDWVKPTYSATPTMVVVPM